MFVTVKTAEVALSTDFLSYLLPSIQSSISAVYELASMNPLPVSVTVWVFDALSNTGVKEVTYAEGATKSNLHTFSTGQDDSNDAARKTTTSTFGSGLLFSALNFVGLILQTS